jgi:hypothetical protein
MTLAKIAKTAKVRMNVEVLISYLGDLGDLGERFFFSASGDSSVSWH